MHPHPHFKFNPPMMAEPSKTPLKADEIEKVLKTIVTDIIKPKSEYKHSIAQLWSNQIVESCTKRFTDLSHAHVKYITTCTIMENRGTGITASTACQWDPDRDVSTTFKYEVKEIICAVTVYQVSMEDPGE